jgi:hypothetical protein
MNKITTNSKKSKLHSPNLDTIITVENFIKKSSGEYKKKKLWEKLPKKMMYQTYCIIISYLSNSKKIAFDKHKKITWIFGNIEINQFKKSNIIHNNEKSTQFKK